MLIVLAIVVVLAALLFPVVSSVRESGRITTCQSNLRQIGLALEIYAGNNNRIYPSALVPEHYCTWADSVAPYLKTTAVLTCPSAPNEYYEAGCAPDENKNGVSHHFNGGYIFNLPDSDRFTQLSQVRIRAPAQMILLTEGDSGNGFTQVGPGSGRISAERFADMGVEVRHRDGANALFADGHTKWLSSTALHDRSLWTVSGHD